MEDSAAICPSVDFFFRSHIIATSAVRRKIDSSLFFTLFTTFHNHSWQAWRWCCPYLFDFSGSNKAHAVWQSPGRTSDGAVLFARLQVHALPLAGEAWALETAARDPGCTRTQVQRFVDSPALFHITGRFEQLCRHELLMKCDKTKTLDAEAAASGNPIAGSKEATPRRCEGWWLPHNTPSILQVSHLKGVNAYRVARVA